MSNRKRNWVIDKLAYYFVKSIQMIMLKLPRHFALRFGAWLGGIIWLVLKLERKRLRVTTDNMRNLFPDESESQLNERARKVCIHYGTFLADCSRLPIFTRSSFTNRIRFEGLGHFRDAYAQDKGLILATAHFGHFEVGAAALALMGYPVHSVIRTVDNLDIDEHFDETRKPTGIGIIKKENSARKILKLLRTKNIVTVHTDLHAGFNNMFIQFFGKWAATFTTPAIMSLRTGAPIVPMYCFRNGRDDSFTIRFCPQVEIAESTGDTGADIRQITTAINDTVEQVIKEAPEQWFWLHNRWKMEPAKMDLELIEKQEALINALVV